MRNLGSSAENGSSNNKMGLSRSKQRASATRCFCPPESAIGFLVKKSCKLTALAACSTSAFSSAFKAKFGYKPKAIFSSTER